MERSRLWIEKEVSELSWRKNLISRKDAKRAKLKPKIKGACCYEVPIRIAVRLITYSQILFQGKALTFKRVYNAVFVKFPNTLLKGQQEKITVFYSGTPSIAKKAPWDGGIVFSKDENGEPWVAVACQGFGASCWWPNKDHQSDEQKRQPVDRDQGPRVSGCCVAHRESSAS